MHPLFYGSLAKGSAYTPYLTGRSLPLFVTQGVAALALGYVLAALSGRSVPTFIKRVVG